MTTKQKRWKVWRDRTLAVLGEDPWVGAPERHWQYRSPKYCFPTHAEAVAYADRMARTVEVVLPRLIENVLTTKQSRVYIHSNGGVSITKRAHYSHVGIPKADLKPLALALLAHHYRSAAP